MFEFLFPEHAHGRGERVDHDARPESQDGASCLGLVSFEFRYPAAVARTLFGLGPAGSNLHSNPLPEEKEAIRSPPFKMFVQNIVAFSPPTPDRHSSHPTSDI